MKKLVVFSVAALSVTPAVAEQSTAPGVIDRNIQIPRIYAPQGQQEQYEAAPVTSSVDDYRGTNRPLPMINSVVFNGPTIIGADELSAITQKYLDRQITDNDIAQLKNEIASEYARRGHPLVKVATPTQDLTRGQLTINIYEGSVGEVRTNANGAIASYVPNAFANRLKGEVYDEESAKSVVNDLNEINNIDASITLQPGVKPLTTDAVINVVPSQGSEDKNYVAVDNYGSELTGEYVGSLHLEKTNALGLGEKVAFDGRVTDDNLYAAGVGGKIPTGILNTYLEAGYTYSKNEIGDRLAFLEQEGSAHAGYVAVSGNVMNRDNRKLTLRGGVEGGNYKIESDLLGTKNQDRLRKVFAEATYIGLHPSLVYQINNKISKGVNFLGGSEEGDANLTRAGNPEAVIYQPSAFARYDFTDNDSVKFFGSAQVANDPLVSSDLYAIGGYGSVRGFEPAQETGENGFAVTAEYQHKFNVADNTAIYVGPWIDHGRIKNKLAAGGASVVDNPLTSAGLGAEVVGQWVPVGETSVRVDWAHPVGSYDNTNVDDNSYYFRVQQDF